MKENIQIWIHTAYRMAALEGLESIKIESLAKKVGISKSSFYHHFADLALFTEQLLAYHLSQASVMAEKERQARTIFPELIEILLEHKIDVLFNRQLRIHSNQTHFAAILVRSDEMIGSSLTMLWTKELNLSLKRDQLEAFYQLALENFFLQVNKDNFTHSWLTQYFKNLQHLAARFTMS